MSRNRKELPQNDKGATTENTVLNGKRLNAFPLRLRTKPECFLSSHLFSIVLAILVSALR